MFAAGLMLFINACNIGNTKSDKLIDSIGVDSTLVLDSTLVVDTLAKVDTVFVHDTIVIRDTVVNSSESVENLKRIIAHQNEMIKKLRK